MDLTSEVYKDTLIHVLMEAAADIQDYGWLPRGAEHVEEIDPFGTYPRCPWIAVIRVIERIRETHPDVETSGILDSAEAALLGVTHVANIGDFFILNDSVTESEGKEWGIGILHEAAVFVNGVSVRGQQEKETVIDSIPSQESGDTTSVVSQPNWFIRNYNRVKSSLSALKGY